MFRTKGDIMLEEFLEKTRNAMCLGCNIFIEGNRTVTIEKCRRIEECSDVFISLISDNMIIRIWGSNLRASNYSTEGLVINGTVSQIEFAEKGTEHR